MDRAERRFRKMRKWISRLKREFYVYGKYYIPMDSEERHNRVHSKKAKTFDELKNSRWGMMLKETGTLFRDNKMLDMEEVRRRNLNNRKITQGEILEAEEELKNGALYTES